MISRSKMRIVFCIAFAFILAPGAGKTVAAEEPETSHLAFVAEYIRELAAVENIRAQGEQELKQGTKDDVFTSAIHSSTLMQLELRSQIAMLKGMRFDPPFDRLIPTTVEFYEHKIDLHQSLIDISSTFIAGPKPGVDFGKLAAEMPKIRAGLEYIDHALFDSSPLVFAILINQKPDSKNHLSHLIITKAQRAKLIADITRDFGSKLDQKNQNWTVSTASVLKGYFLKDYKCSDEPWD